MIYGNYEEVSQSNGREWRAVSPPAFLNRGVRSSILRPRFTTNKGTFRPQRIDDIGDLRGRSISRRVTLATDRRRSGFPISYPNTLSIVGISQTRSPTPGPSLEVARYEETRVLAIVRKCAEKGIHATPKSLVRGRGTFRHIELPRRYNLKRTDEFTFARYAPPFSLEAFDSSRSRVCTLAVYPICSR